MNQIREYFKSEKYQQQVAPEVKRVLAVIFFTVIYGFGVAWFLEASAIPMYTGGIPGIAQLVRDFLVIRLNITALQGAGSGLFLGAFVIVANIPVILLGWFGVSKKFTIYSIISILIQAFILGFIPEFNLGLNSNEHILVCAILGGALIGLGTGGALKYGASTGGLDIVAQYFALRKNKTVGFFSMFMNVAIAVLGGVIVNDPSAAIPVYGGVITAYTIIRIVISTIMTDKIHTAYQFMSVEVITSNPQDIIDAILVKLYRGVTISKVYGAYSKAEKSLIMVVIATYELPSLNEIIRKTDDKAFIIVKPVKHVFGNFKRKTIA